MTNSAFKTQFYRFANEKIIRNKEFFLQRYPNKVVIVMSNFQGILPLECLQSFKKED